MLIHIRHSQPREVSPDRLMFHFEVPSLIERFRSRSSKKRGSGEADSAVSDPALIPVTPGDRLFAQLAPQRGDTFSIELPAPARSEVIIFISPLRSLIRDRRTSLKIHSPRGLRPLHIDFTVLRLGRIRVLYISPESMVSRSLREDLSTLIEGFWPTTLIMDQAHRFSEWSDEFDPACHRLIRIIADLRRTNPALSALALTGEFGDRIRTDVLSLLEGFRDVTPPMRVDFYRPRVSFQAVAVDSFQKKTEAYHTLLSRDIPQLLGEEGIFNQIPEEVPPYQDPYARFPEEFQRSADGESTELKTPAITTYSTLTGPEKPHLLLRTTLDGDKETWLCRAARTGMDGNRVHCLHLVDLPAPACEADMLNRRSRIPACGDRICAFEREELCDYGKQHHLILRRHPDGVSAAVQVLQLLDRLLGSHAAGDSPLRIHCDDLDRGAVARALFRLSVLGMVELFYIDFREADSLFKVYGFTEAMNPEAAAVGLYGYLQKNDLSPGKKYASHIPEGVPDVAAELDRSRRLFGEPIREWLRTASAEGLLHHLEDDPDYFYGIADYVPLLADQVGGAMRETAYRRLWNLKRFIQGSECRYAGLLTAVRATDEDWGCGSCDRCVPDLAFGRAEQTPPPESLFLQELEKRFQSWMENQTVGFESDAADRFIQDFGDAYANLRGRSRRTLEHDPYNLKALYVARELARPDEGEMEALDLMTVVVRDLPRLQAVRFYETFRGDADVKRAQFDLMDDVHGPFNCTEGEQWLLREAREAGLSEERIDFLAAREVLNILQRTDLTPHCAKLSQLVEEF